MATPDWQAWLSSQWGPSFDGSGVFYPAVAASNVVIGNGNPPYTIQDFFSFYPKWGGCALFLAGTTTTENSVVVSVPDATGLAIGNPVSGPGIPDGTFIESISGTNVTLTNEATAGGSITLTVWNNTVVPVAVILAYITLANASLTIARWFDTWALAMGLFVAHFLTLYARSDGNPNSTLGQIAAQGISTGIQVSKSAGDVSVGYETVKGIEDWGAWNLTTYGQQLVTFARIIGGGPQFLW
jgi:hypothetical protein